MNVPDPVDRPRAGLVVMACVEPTRPAVRRWNAGGNATWAVTPAARRTMVGSRARAASASSYIDVPTTVKPDKGVCLVRLDQQ